MTVIWTAQYKYSGPDRVDVTTRKTHPQGAAFASAWRMVEDYKNGTLIEPAYIQQ